jgi:hypothetical protein
VSTEIYLVGNMRNAIATRFEISGGGNRLLGITSKRAVMLPKIMSIARLGGIISTCCMTTSEGVHEYLASDKS